MGKEFYRSARSTLQTKTRKKMLEKVMKKLRRIYQTSRSSRQEERRR